MKVTIEKEELSKFASYKALETVLKKEPQGLLGLARDLTFILAAHDAELGEIDEVFTTTVTSNAGINAYFEFISTCHKEEGTELSLELPQDETGGIDPTQYVWYKIL